VGQYQQNGAAFSKQYLQALSLGGSASPEDVTTVMGADIQDPTFWQNGLSILDDQVRSLEQ